MSFSPFYTGVEEKGKKRRIKENTMAQWINLKRKDNGTVDKPSLE